jgi:predicted dehydrogenase
MLRVGIVGIGFMGMMHYLAYQKVRGVKVAAVCSRDKKKLAGDWRSIKGNFGPPGEQMDLKGIQPYERWEDLIADPRIDLIDNCLPPDLHAPVTIAALKAGKHVLVEKPIALTNAEAERMVAAAKQSGKLLMIAQVLPFFPEYAFALKAICGGKYGKLLGGNFKRIIAEPSWLKDFWNPKKVGGPLVDLHIHDAHFIRLACGMPSGLFSSGRMRGDVVEFASTQFLYPKENLAVTASSGVLGQKGRDFTHAFEIYLEKATLLYDFAVLDGKPTLNVPLTVLSADGKVTQPKLPEGDAFVGELTEAVKAIRTGEPSSLLAGELAMDALALCHKQTQSVVKGKVVKV